MVSTLLYCLMYLHEQDVKTRKTFTFNLIYTFLLNLQNSKNVLDIWYAKKYFLHGKISKTWPDFGEKAMNKNKYTIENILELSNKNWKLREINLIECINPVYETQQKIKSITAKVHCSQVINIRSNHKEKI